MGSTTTANQHQYDGVSMKDGEWPTITLHQQMSPVFKEPIEFDVSIYDTANKLKPLKHYGSGAVSATCEMEDGEQFSISLRYSVGYAPVCYQLNIGGVEQQRGIFTPWDGDTNDVWQGPKDSAKRFTFSKRDLGSNNRIEVYVWPGQVVGSIVDDTEKKKTRSIGLSGEKTHEVQVSKWKVERVGQPAGITITLVEKDGIEPLPGAMNNLRSN